MNVLEYLVSAQLNNSRKRSRNASLQGRLKPIFLKIEKTSLRIAFQRQQFDGEQCICLEQSLSKIFAKHNKQLN